MKRTRLSLCVLALTTVTTAGFSPALVQSWGAAILLVTALVCAAAACGARWRSHLDLADRQRSEEKLRDLTSQLVTARETERRRIARELHDDVSQRIALLTICIDQIRYRSEDEDIRDSM